jgi:hypothetical protein
LRGGMGHSLQHTQGTLGHTLAALADKDAPRSSILLRRCQLIQQLLVTIYTGRRWQYACRGCGSAAAGACCCRRW